VHAEGLGPPRRLRGGTAPLAAVAALLVAACESPTVPPVQPEPLARWSEVAAGTYFTCGVTTEGAPHCWGFYAQAPDHHNQFGVSLRPVPVPVPEGVRLRHLTAGGGIVCALDLDDRPWCWGPDVVPPSDAGEGWDRRTPVPVQGGMRLRSISRGWGLTCGVTLGGEAFCWGSDLLPERVTVPGEELSFLSVSVGTTQICLVDGDHRLWCWGGGYGSVGVPELDPRVCPMTSPCTTDVPLPVAHELRFAMVSAGNGFTCAVTLAGAGYCWGGLFLHTPDRQFGVLGSGSPEGSAVPVPVAGGIELATISTGTRAACGLSTRGAAHCWGENTMGELGIGTSDRRAHPVPERVDGGHHFDSLSLAEVSCGITAEGVLRCWGNAYGGLLGNGVGEWRAYPRPVPVLDPGEALP
jgi:alpha-tubulin suppressor-like RCC1 family protein